MIENIKVHVMKGLFTSDVLTHPDCGCVTIVALFAKRGNEGEFTYSTNKDNWHENG